MTNGALIIIFLTAIVAIVSTFAAFCWWSLRDARKRANEDRRVLPSFSDRLEGLEGSVIQLQRRVYEVESLSRTVSRSVNRLQETQPRTQPVEHPAPIEAQPRHEREIMP